MKNVRSNESRGVPYLIYFDIGSKKFTEQKVSNQLEYVLAPNPKARMLCLSPCPLFVRNFDLDPIFFREAVSLAFNKFKLTLAYLYDIICLRSLTQLNLKIALIFCYGSNTNWCWYFDRFVLFSSNSKNCLDKIGYSVNHQHWNGMRSFW